jgi:18S rRNA (guanine1575-N7)-methyltransferase
MAGGDDDEEEVEGGEVRVAGRDRAHKKGRLAKTKSKSKKGGVAGGGVAKGSKTWVLKKKHQMRVRGYEGIPTDTKYTGRKRKRLGL